MFRLIVTSVLLCSFQIGLCQLSSTAFKSGEFRSFASTDLIFKDIVTDSGYIYWECVYNPTSIALLNETRQVLERKGALKFGRIARKYKTKSGFFTSCGPGLCSYYIVAVRKDKSVDLINTPEALKSFIGKIDNIEELKLLIRNNGYAINSSPTEIGSYQEREQDYLLNVYKLQDSHFLPETKPVQKITATMTKSGEFIVGLRE